MADLEPDGPSRVGAFDVDDDGRLVAQGPAAGKPDPLASLMHGQFRGTVLSPAFPCLGAASAVRRGHYRFAVYRELGSEGAIESCASDLARFIAERPPAEFPVAAFIAAFAEPAMRDEAQFESLLWRHLSGLEEVDRSGPIPADELVDPSDPGFVFARRELFIVGLSPVSSRWARRCGWPVLVFNALSHSAALREAGKYERMKGQILSRDRELQGCDNPSLAAPQPAQFSGRAVDGSWRCPHRPDGAEGDSLSS